MIKQLIQITCATSIFLSLSALAKETVVEKQSFSLANIQVLSLKMDHTNITVTSSESQTLAINLRQKLNSGDPDYCIHKIVHSQTGKKLTVYTEAQKHGKHKRCSIQRELELEIDQRSLQQLNFAHNHGSVSVDIFNPDALTLNISHSKLKLSDITSHKTTLKLNHTDTDIRAIKTSSLKAKGSHGDIEISELNADNFSFKWSHGDFQLGKSQVKKLTASQSHGNFRLQNHEGSELKLHNSHGDIYVNEENSSIVELKNSHGPIDYKGGANTLFFSNTHGSTKVSQQESEFARIDGKSTHGSIDLALPKNSICSAEGLKKAKVRAEMFKDTAACNDETSSGIVELRTSHGKVRVLTF